MSVTYFISDIHLHANSLEQTEMLRHFLQTKAIDADAVYILGDLFAIWLGDDIAEPYVQNLKEEIQNLSKNVPVYFMRGNRDFLIGEKFCKESNCQLLNDPSMVNLYGQDVLLTHGDQLCTLDKSYQKFRKLVQNPIVDKIFLLLPLTFRQKIGRHLSKKSRGSIKDPALYDVSAKTVEEWFAKHNVDLMIHGHTHMPFIHNNNEKVRIVLGDWTARSAQILAYSANTYALIDLAKL